MIYFDHNATTPLDERVLEVMMPYLGYFYANPSSLYRAGRMVRSAIDTARQQVAALFGVSAAQVVFTSGGTEANNLALKGAMDFALPRTIAIGAFEHPSILDTALSLPRSQAISVETISIDANGCFSMSHVDELLGRGLDFISLMLVNNETGVIQDIEQLAVKLQQHEVILHTDAVQAAGKIAVDFARLGVDMMSVSSHKLYGPKGCGALIIDNNCSLHALHKGGGQEQGLRAGTENVAAIIGFGKAAELALAELKQRQDDNLQLITQLQNGLLSIPGLEIFGHQAKRISNTLQFGVPGVDGEMILMQMDGKGIAISSGSACASGGGEPSHVLMSMGVEAALAKSAVRVSVGQSNTAEDIQCFVNTLKSFLPSPI